MYFKCCKIAMYYIVKLLLTIQLSLFIMRKKMRGLTLLAEIHVCEPGKVREPLHTACNDSLRVAAPSPRQRKNVFLCREEGAATHRLLQRGL